MQAQLVRQAPNNAIGQREMRRTVVTVVRQAQQARAAAPRQKERSRVSFAVRTGARRREHRQGI